MTDTAQAQMPQYQCHKKVWALKIEYILIQPDGSVTLRFIDERYDSISMPSAWREKHSPRGGGYLVIYEDGYRSWSPAEAFEAGYTLIGG